MSPNFRAIATNGVNLRAAVQGEGPLIVLVHGFPESWYSWRHQIAPLAAAGFTIAAIDVRGYGGSDKPHAVEAYAMQELAADVAGVIDVLSPGKPAIIIGHDWGAPIVYATALLHPDRVRAVCGMSVPYAPAPMPLNHLFKAMFTDQGRFLYMVYFQDEGVAEAAFEADVRAGLLKLYHGGSAAGGGWTGADKVAGDALLEGMTYPDPFPSWLPESDIRYFVGEFEGSGFRGPLNRYRNFERDFAAMQGRDLTIRQPSLFVCGAEDLVLRMFGGGEAAVERMRANMSDLRGAHLLPGVGHFLQQESPDETTMRLIDWLATL